MMYSHSGTWDFLKLLTVVLFVVSAVAWLQYFGGFDFAFGVVTMIILVAVFAVGALFAHTNQKMTLDAFNKANAQDAQIDKYRMQSFKAMATGQSAMDRAAASLTVLDAKRVDKLADQRSKLLIADHNASTQPESDTWSWDDDSVSTIDDSGEYQRWE